MMIIPVVIVLGSTPRTMMMSPTFKVGIMLPEETTINGESV
jgi:hypothetical protein